MLLSFVNFHVNRINFDGMSKKFSCYIFELNKVV